MLVKAPRTVGIPRVQLCGHSQVDKPVHLDRLPVGLWPVSRNYIAVFSDLKKLLPPYFIPLLLCHLSGKSRIPSPQSHNRVTADTHGSQLLPLFQCLQIAGIVQSIQGILNVLLIVQKAFLIDFFRANCMSRPSLLHKFRENSCAVACLPLLGHRRENPMADGTLLPEGDNLLLLDFQIPFRHLKGNQLPVVHDPHVLHGVAAQLRESGRRLRAVPLLPYDQLPIADAQLPVLHKMQKSQSSHLRHRDGALILFIGLCFQHRPLQADSRLRVPALSSEHSDPLIHSSLFHSAPPPLSV